MSEYVTVNGKKFKKPSQKRVRVKKIIKTKVIKGNPVIEVVKPSQADSSGEAMTPAQIRAVEQKIEELQGPEKEYMKTYLKNMALGLAEEMMLILANAARNGDRAAARVIVEQAVGKATERKPTDSQPIEVILPNYREFLSEAGTEDDSAG